MTAPQAIEPGSVFAQDFRVVRLLAEGGMGAVYVVDQLSTGRQRALKVMLPQFVKDAKTRARFEQEAKVGGLIQSEHIVEVLIAGVDAATGMPFLVMELLEGEELQSLVQRHGGLPPSEILEIFRQICHGLGAAHRVGLVHRDLKPSNIFIGFSRREGTKFTAKILDFGIAKLIQRGALDSTQAIGSPLYMSPEQTHSGGEITAASDVWALGLIAFYSLTGKSYWRVANDPEGHPAALFTELLNDPLDPPSVRAVAIGSTRTLPQGFDSWFARCVNRDPMQRFIDANGALSALIPLLGSVTSPVSPLAQNIGISTEIYRESNAPKTLAATGTGLVAEGSNPSAQASDRPASAVPRMLALVGILCLAVTTWITVRSFRMSTATPLQPSTASHIGTRPSVPTADVILVPAVVTPPEIADMATGREHTCARVTDGTVRCWGRNLYGQLGDGTEVNRATPVIVAGLTGVSQLALGREHSCARINDGTVRCWGRNISGQLGDGTMINRSAPVAVAQLRDVVQIAAGDYHTCARVSDNSIHCWGQNAMGELGDRTREVRSLPVVVDGIDDAQLLSVGGAHGCVVRANGEAWCWGWNEYGQLGDGSNDDAPEAVRVHDLRHVALVSAGGDSRDGSHTCARLIDGTVRCWGWNAFGQLGEGTTVNRSHPILVAGLDNVLSIATGAQHTCVQRVDGTALCWGANASSQLGTGGADNHSTPTLVPGVTGVAQIVAGGEHTCAMTGNGSIVCWGSNRWGQLGDGTFVSRAAPGPMHW